MADFFRAPDLIGGKARGSGGGGSSGSDTIRGHLERQPDGSVSFKVIFDVQGYSPEDLRTSLVGDRTVQVAGRSTLEDRATGKQTSMSFEEQFTLPENVDATQLRSVVSNSQLVISAPVSPPQYKNDGGGGSLKSPRPQSQLQSPQSQPQPQPQPSPQPQPQPSPNSTSPSTSFSIHSTQPQAQPQQQQQQSTVKRYNVYQLELDLGREFTPADLKISTLEGGSRLVVHGQRQVRGAGKTSFREFRDEFDLPAGLDLAQMTARLRSDGRVIVEAPFRADTEHLGAGGTGFDFQTLPVLHH